MAARPDAPPDNHHYAGLAAVGVYPRTDTVTSSLFSPRECLHSRPARGRPAPRAPLPARARASGRGSVCGARNRDARRPLLWRSEPPSQPPPLAADRPGRRAARQKLLCGWALRAHPPPARAAQGVPPLAGGGCGAPPSYSRAGALRHAPPRMIVGARALIGLRPSGCAARPPRSGPGGFALRAEPAAGLRALRRAPGCGRRNRSCGAQRPSGAAAGPDRRMARRAE